MGKLPLIAASSYPAPPESVPSTPVTPMLATEDRERLDRVLRGSGDATGNPSPEEMRRLIRRVERIAVVGMSRDPMKATRRIPSYLAAMGAEIVPVNPYAGRLLGRTARKTLEDVIEPVDMVLIFRPSAEAAPFVRAAAARPEAPVIWLQEGIRDDEAAAEGRAAGRTVVQDLCIYRVHRAMGGTLRRGLRRD